MASKAIYQALIKKKSTTLLSDMFGRKIYSVELTPVWRRDNMDMFGRAIHKCEGFEIKRKADVTGVCTDEGYLLIDSRK